MVHVQWIDTPTESVFIELTRRCPGDLYALLVERSVGLKYANIYAKSFLGETAYEWSKRGKIDPWIRVTLIGSPGSRYLGFEMNERSASQVLFYPTLERGNIIRGTGRIGVAFIRSSDPDTAFSLALEKKLFQVF